MASRREREIHRHLESPGVMFFRVTVMLSCLILVPLAAIFGSAFPELVNKHLVDRIKMFTGSVSGPVATTSDREQGATPPVATAAGWQTNEAAPAWQPAVDPAVQQVDYSSVTTPPPTGESVAPKTVDHFTLIQQRLREYGATYYALESLEDGSGYRFRCAMGIAGSSAVEQFQSQNRDALQAMATVMSEVEAWRARSQRPSGARLGQF